MTVQLSRPSDARHMRLSLKRGLARHVMTTAVRAQADHEVIVGELFKMSPNSRSIDRTARRLRKASGVVCSGIARGQVVEVLRNIYTMITRKEGVEAFTDDAVIYTRVGVLREKHKVTTSISRATFSQHALERFIERGSCTLGASFVDANDAEGLALLRRFVSGRLIEYDGDNYLPASETGVWAGSEDATSPEPGWRIGREDACIPTFSARTFLGPDEMNPCVWLRWQDDPRLSLAA